MISSLEIGFDPVGGDSDGQRSFPRPLDLIRFWSKITYFVPSKANGQSLQMGPKTFFLTSHHMNGMIGSKNPSKIQN